MYTRCCAYYYIFYFLYSIYPVAHALYLNNFSYSFNTIYSVLRYICTIDQRVFVTFNPFNVYVTQADAKPGCVLRPANVVPLLQQGMVYTICVIYDVYGLYSVSKYIFMIHTILKLQYVMVYKRVYICIYY